jgi:hypothetical protein
VAGVFEEGAMSTAAINIANWKRRRAKGLGDDAAFGSSSDFTPFSDAAAGGPGTVSVPDLIQQTKAGMFNNLQTPFPYFGDVTLNQDPYAAQTRIIPGPGNANDAFNVYTADFNAANEGGGGGAPVSIGATNQPAATTGALSATAQPAAAAATSSSDLLSSITSLLGTPIYAGSSITWGWALLAAGVAWLLFRERS